MTGIRCICASLIAIGSFWSEEANAQVHTAHQFDLPPQPLSAALKAVGAQANVSIIFDAPRLEGRQASALHTMGTLDEALALLLQGSGLTHRFLNETTVVLSDTRPPTQPAVELQEIVVTGTHIRGVQTPASPVITIDRDAIESSGYATVGEVVQSIPQVFGGGQNPGIGGAIDQGNANQNLTSASSINLRGIGPDATLTLINGHRLSYDSFVQATDISAIPLPAISRIELITDGASALYGSDAVAGVANIVLRDRYDGVQVSARGGGATRGAYDLQNYSLLAGATGARSSAYVAYELNDESAVNTDQRAPTESIPTPFTVWPRQRRNSLVTRGQLELSEHLSASLDALHTKRTSEVIYANPVTRSFSQPDVEQVSVVPSFVAKLPAEWAGRLSAVYSEDESEIETRTFAGTLPISSSSVCYCNRTKSVELTFDGPLRRLAGGSLSAAIGGGQRTTEFEVIDFISGADVVSGNRDASYLFGELNVPWIGRHNARAGAHRLELNLAARYDSYDDVGDVFTPKVGVVYGVNEVLTLRTSWGESFKAPTLSQQHTAFAVLLVDASLLGGAGYPAGATALLTGGGNTDLASERSRSWNISATVAPPGVPGASLTASYFDIRYEDRVIQPFPNAQVALVAPLNPALIVSTPSLEQQGAVIARDADGLLNLSSGAYTPANVVAIVRNDFLNAASQHIRGIDLMGEYLVESAKGTFTFSGNASWLRLAQQLTANSAQRTLSGKVFNPPEFRARLGLSWRYGGWGVSSYLNHTGEQEDIQLTPAGQISSWTTFDAQVSYSPGRAAGLLRDVDVRLAAQNLFDANPPRVFTPSVTSLPYDSTNSSLLGRVLSVALIKEF
jgi:iron complex outermembrane recepter protein